MKNKVLVLLASYNGKNYIREQLNSILSQNNVDVNIYIFDDCSTDNSFIDLLQVEDKRVFLIKNSEQTGSAAKNFLNSLQSLVTADTLSKFDYVSFADQDDIWLPNKLYRAVSKIEQENVHLYCSNLTIWNEGTNEKKLLQKSQKQKKFDYLFEGASAGCTYVFTTEFAIKLINNYSQIDLSSWKYFSHDWYTYFFARVNKFMVHIDDQSFIFYRIHDNNVHGQLNLNNLDSIFKRIQLVKSGWYFNHLNNYKKLISSNSEEYYIYQMYCQNIFTRIFILLKYNFKLMRSNKKFIKFFFTSILFNANKM
jgi:rhamnosyltransferase